MKTQEETEGRKSRKIIALLARVKAADCFASLFRLCASVQHISLVTGKIINTCPLAKFSENNELANTYSKSHGTLGIPKDLSKRHFL